MKPINPFITSGYISPKYFCDREIESKKLKAELINGNNVALISTRRMGKTGLIRHVFNDQQISKSFYTFFIDIYATKSLREFIFALSK
ncbi:MAG: ATPase, partial [Porphyromonadaceae bacterium]|nr:ATPase [Porphyromonadaceae bacterium]